MKENIVTVKNYLSDRGNYLRGLLILISKDNAVHEHEKEIFLDEGTSMGYEKGYLDSSLNSVLKNRYILKTPPIFHDKNYAIKLVEKGISIINKDKTLHPYKVVFLKSIVHLNNLLNEWDNGYFSKILPKITDADNNKQ